MAFGEVNNIISIYHLNNDIKRTLLICKSRPEGISISPDGKHIIFMTRDGSHVNDDDGWRPNLFTLENKDLVKISSTNDIFGVLGNFWWKEDSSAILFTGFLLDDKNNSSYNYWSYNLITQELYPYFGDFKYFQNQKVRYWVADKWH